MSQPDSIYTSPRAARFALQIKIGSCGHGNAGVESCELSKTASIGCDPTSFLLGFAASCGGILCVRRAPLRSGHTIDWVASKARTPSILLTSTHKARTMCSYHTRNDPRTSHTWSPGVDSELSSNFSKQVTKTLNYRGTSTRRTWPSLLTPPTDTDDAPFAPSDVSLPPRPS